MRRKRALDLVLAIGAAIVASPLILLVALAVRWRLGSPVLFRQDRPGYLGAPFRLVKFRTMRDAVGARGQPLSDAERLTRFGAWLRSTSLDELPELWNVFCGEMSLVGPRPLLMEYMPLYSERQLRRHDMPPGITGLAQIKGRNAIEWDEVLAWDLRYVEGWSFATDLRILAATAGAVLLRRGISEPGQATRSRFTGSSSEPRN